MNPFVFVAGIVTGIVIASVFVQLTDRRWR